MLLDRRLLVVSLAIDWEVDHDCAEYYHAPTK